MSAWTPEELDRIAAAQELEIAPQRRDGTLRRPVPIWVVRAGPGALHDAQARARRAPPAVGRPDGRPPGRSGPARCWRPRQLPDPARHLDHDHRAASWLFEALVLTYGVDEKKVRAMDADEALELYLKFCEGGAAPA